AKMSCSPIESSTAEARQGRWDWPTHDGVIEVQNDSEKFVVHLDAQNFAPEEIEVKVVGRLMDIHAEHKSRKDGTRTLTRSFKLPEDVNEHAIKTFLSPRGTLVIKAFKNSCTSNPRILLHDKAWLGVAEKGMYTRSESLDCYPVQLIRE
ncbi:hypothetical protein PENTCL1PPCAC_4724, partial [Pristionchus entomophagus]